VEAAFSNIISLISGVVMLYGDLHVSLKRLLAISLFGWLLVFPLIVFVGRLLSRARH